MRDYTIGVKIKGNTYLKVYKAINSAEALTMAEKEYKEKELKPDHIWVENVVYFKKGK